MFTDFSGTICKLIHTAQPYAQGHSQELGGAEGGQGGA